MDGSDCGFRFLRETSWFCWGGSSKACVGA